MKLLYFSTLACVLLAICSLENVLAETTPDPTTTPESKDTLATTPTSGNTTVASTTPKGESAGVTNKTDTTAPMTKLQKVGVEETCEAKVDACLKKPTFDDITCDAFKKTKTCLQDGTNKCSDDDYSKLEVLICSFCPRTVASMLLVGILCALAKLLARQ